MTALFPTQIAWPLSIDHQEQIDSCQIFFLRNIPHSVTSFEGNCSWESAWFAYQYLRMMLSSPYLDAGLHPVYVT